MEPKRALVKVTDLYSDSVEIWKENEMQVLLNQEPKKEWIKQHPTASNVRYLPIERIEFLLTAIFTRWRVEVKEVKLIANSVVAVIRLHYFNPASGDWDFTDGVGAAPLQTDKDKGAIDFDHIKNNAVMLGAPAAESYAIKDAAEKLGKIFGKDLNRKDVIGYDALSGRMDESYARELKDRIINRLKEYQGDDRDGIAAILKEKSEAGEADLTFLQNIASQLSLNIN